MGPAVLSHWAGRAGSGVARHASMVRSPAPAGALAVPERGRRSRRCTASFRLHIDEQIDEHIAAGMTPAEARAAAMREFGPMARIEEECRDTRRVAFVHNLARDLRYTLRSLARQPLLLLAATVSIAVAVGANTTIFNLASELLFSTPSAREPERLVRIRMSGNSHVSYRQWQALERVGRPERARGLSDRSRGQLARRRISPSA